MHVVGAEEADPWGDANAGDISQETAMWQVHVVREVPHKATSQHQPRSPRGSCSKRWKPLVVGELLEHLVARRRASTLAWTARGHEKRRKTSGCYIKSTSVHSLEW